jgi:hypothetical protein
MIPAHDPLFPDRMKEFKYTYNYIDVITGNAYVAFYAGDAYDSSGSLNYILSTLKFSPQNRYTTLASDTTTTINFDIQLGKTHTIKGKVILNFLAKTDNSISTDYEVKLKHYNGSTATDIIEIGDYTWDPGITGTEHNYKRFCFSGDVTTEYTIPKGDYLRLTFVATTGETVGGSFRLYHDPYSRDQFDKSYTYDDDGTEDPHVYTVARSYGSKQTDLMVLVPFKTENI